MVPWVNLEIDSNGCGSHRLEYILIKPISLLVSGLLIRLSISAEVNTDLI